MTVSNDYFKFEREFNYSITSEKPFRWQKFFLGSLETRLNSVAKSTEFVPKPFLACVTFFVTLEYKELRQVVNTSSNF